LKKEALRGQRQNGQRQKRLRIAGLGTAIAKTNRK
jgi:hypothetical protein